MQHELIVCNCHSLEHQMIITLDDDWDELYLSIHLNNLPLLKRILYAIKYLFGYKSTYGAFDEMIIDINSAKQLNKQLTNFIKKHKDNR